MYDVRQFRPALYVLVLLGMSGFALAAQSPGIWLLATAGILLNGWLVKTGRFHPMPHLVASAVTLGSMLYVGLLVARAGMTPILLIGEFLVVLQLVKLYEQRSNRDYAQLLVLSLLLMVAASINTASLIFGLMLIVYLFLSLYCCLLFHLKVEADLAQKTISLPPERIGPNTLRQDQRFLTRSMRRLTGLIASVAITMAVAVFLFCPRLPASNVLGPLQFRSSQTLTGFSENVGFQQVAKITQSDAVVAHVHVFHNGTRVDGTQPLVLRGVTLDCYNGTGNSGGAAWSWDRSRSPDMPWDFNEDEPKQILLTEAPDRWMQEVSLYATGSNVLFAMAGITGFKSDRHVTLRYAPGDETFQSVESIVQPLSYEVVSRGYVGRLEEMHDEVAREPSPAPRGITDRGIYDPNVPPPANRSSEIDPKIVAFARDPRVTGSDADGPLWQQRPLNAPPQPLDDRIATNIENYLRGNFQYTLDLTDAARIAGQDPMVAFLYDLKRGHCEYFAGAMTLLCQSLGMEARMVVGFKCDEYNTLGGYYIVRQTHAHAWVEVQMPNGAWKMYDPTSGRISPARRGGMLATMKNAFDFLEYTWANNVIAYDRTRRDNMVMNVESGLTNTALQTTDNMARFRNWLYDRQNGLRAWLFDADRWYGTYQILSFLMAFMVLSLLFAIAWFVFERWRMRLRALRIGIDALPTAEQLRLARQLGFYDELLKLLERHGVYRSPHLTPLEFGQSLSYLPVEAFLAVHRLTRIFYRIRYGGAQLQPAHRRRLTLTLTRLESFL